MTKNVVILLTAALVATACGQSEKPAPAKTAAAEKPAPKAEKKDEAKPAEAKPDPEAAKAERWKKKLDSRVLADSGLGVGGKLSAFEIINCDSGDEYCQVCKFGSSPKIMAIGSPADEDFRKDLAALDAMVKKYGEDKVKAFAVVTDIDGGKAPTPVANKEDAQKKAKAIRDELKLAMPVVIPAPEEGKANKIWEEYYNVTASRTIMFADGKNEVKYSAVAPKDLAELEGAVKTVVGG